VADDSFGAWGTDKLDDGDFSGSTATEQVVWSANANDRLSPVHLSVSHTLAGSLKVFYGSATAGNFLVNAHFGANQGIIREFMPKVGKRGGGGRALKVLSDGGGIVLCHVEGYRGRKDEQ
jgi:hypothetical protein